MTRACSFTTKFSSTSGRSREDGTLVDATVGLGGHAEALLKRYPRCRLVAIDRDPAALERSRERLGQFADRVTFVRGRHETLIDILKQSGIESDQRRARRPRRLLDAARRRVARVFVPLRRAARHAHGAGRHAARRTSSTRSTSTSSRGSSASTARSRWRGGSRGQS